MKISAQRLNQLMDFLRQKLIHENSEERTELQNAAKKATQPYHPGLGQRLASEQDQEADVIHQYIANHNNHPLLLKDKERLLKNIHISANQIADFNLDLSYSTAAYQKQLNGCMEHATLMFLSLYLECADSNEMLIESVVAYIPTDKRMNHNFLVLNRNKTGQLEDVLSWGDDCLIVDTWRGIIASPIQMPEGSAVYNLMYIPGIYKVQVKYDNQFGLRGLNTYPNTSVFHKVEAISRRVLQNELDKLLATYSQQITFPSPEAPAIADALSAADSQRFFSQSKADSIPAVPISSHDLLLSRAKHLTSDKKDFDLLIKALENKNYALALRRACVVGHLELIQCILSFHDQLQFDINEPSISAQKTALDWLDEACTKPQNKVIGTNLLLKAGALRFAEVSNTNMRPSPLSS